MRATELIQESLEFIRLGQYDKAIQRLNHTLIVEPKNVDAKNLLIDSYLQKDDYQSVLDVINDLLSEDNNNTDLLLIKSVCLNDIGLYDEAIEICNLIISLKNDLFVVYGLRGIAFIELEEIDRAFADLNYALEKDENNFLFLSHRALIHIYNQNFKQALSDLNKALKFNTTFDHARLNRAFVYRLLGDNKKAINDLKKIKTDLQLDSESYHQKGIIFYKNNDFNDALINYNLAIENDSNNVEALYSRAILFCQMGEFEKSLNDLDHSMNIDNFHFIDYLLNGYAYVYFKMREYNKAIEFANKSIAENEDFFWANLSLAEIYGALDNTTDFYENLKIAIKGGIGLEDIDKSIRDKYSKDKIFRQLTKKIKRKPSG